MKKLLLLSTIMLLPWSHSAYTARPDQVFEEVERKYNFPTLEELEYESLQITREKIKETLINEEIDRTFPYYFRLINPKTIKQVDNFHSISSKLITYCPLPKESPNNINYYINLLEEVQEKEKYNITSIWKLSKNILKIELSYLKNLGDIYEKKSKELTEKEYLLFTSNTTRLYDSVSASWRAPAYLNFYNHDYETNLIFNIRLNLEKTHKIKNEIEQSRQEEIRLNFIITDDVIDNFLEKEKFSKKEFRKIEKERQLRENDPEYRLKILQETIDKQKKDKEIIDETTAYINRNYNNFWQEKRRCIDHICQKRECLREKEKIKSLYEINQIALEAEKLKNEKRGKNWEVRYQNIQAIIKFSKEIINMLSNPHFEREVLELFSNELRRLEGFQEHYTQEEKEDLKKEFLASLNIN